MKERPLVTLSFPVYEGDEYVAASILSVLNQDYENLEILIVDDCGNTHAMQIVRDCISKHPCRHNIRILRQPYNMKLGAARNRSLNEAKGEYIFFMDSDDTITPNCISLLVNTAITNHTEITEGGCRDTNNNFCRQNKSIQKQLTKGKILLDAEYNDGIQISYYMTNKLFRIEFLRKNDIRCEYPVFEDYHHTFIAQFKGTSFASIPDVTYIYTLHSDNITGTLLYNKHITKETAAIVEDFVSKEYAILENWKNPVTRERGLVKCIKMGAAYTFRVYQSDNISKSEARLFSKSYLNYPKLRKADYALFTPYEKKKHIYYRFLQLFPLSIRLILFKCINFTFYICTKQNSH